MSIYIKDMEMPQNCDECNFHQYHSHGEYVCVATPLLYPMNLANYKGGRKSFCPLEEISTPHGRLGDLDALIKTLEQNRLCYVLDIDDESFELGIDKAISIVKEVPTVIEVED